MKTPPNPLPPDPMPLYPVRVIRSKKRKRTVSARLVEGVLELSVPHWLSAKEERQFSERMQQRFARKKVRSSTDLEARCAVLAARYSLPEPASVRWVTNQSTRWGSCTTTDASIRMSDRMQVMPEWVIDAVLVHELAHLVEPNHGPAFKALESRFERLAEAAAFLDGVTWAANHHVSPSMPDTDVEPTPDTTPNTDDEPTPDTTPDAVDQAGLARDNPIELQGFDGGLDVGQLRFDLG